MTNRTVARILIVDDEVRQMKALCDTLGDQGYETVGFSSPNAALEALSNGGFDLILTDLMMPEMDGITLLNQAWERDPSAVAIVMTGQGTIATAVEAMQAGAIDYILKPFKVSAILPVLKRALAMRKLRVENLELQKRERQHAAELEDANKELDAFTHSVSHDLRAPLRAVSGYTGMLLADYSGILPAEAKDYLGRISANTHRMTKLIDDLLRLSHLGRQDLVKQRVDVATLVRELVEDLQLHSSGEIEVVIHDLPETNGDPALLRQVFFNLLSNAFKFTAKRENPRAEVGYRRADGEITYFVSDNGAGFDMQYAEHLFETFHRLHRAEEFEGSGVGLSIVQRIVHRHGGRVWADASVNGGATFYVSLPQSE